MIQVPLANVSTVAILRGGRDDRIDLRVAEFTEHRRRRCRRSAQGGVDLRQHSTAVYRLLVCAWVCAAPGDFVSAQRTNCRLRQHSSDPEIVSHRHLSVQVSVYLSL